MIFDSDILIWNLRGSDKARAFVAEESQRYVSIASCMELYFGAKDKQEMKLIEVFLQSFNVLPLTSEIGERAASYLREYALQCRLDPVDAIVAATATTHEQTLATGNAKHFRNVQGLDLRVFRI